MNPPITIKRSTYQEICETIDGRSKHFTATAHNGQLAIRTDDPRAYLLVGNVDHVRELNQLLSTMVHEMDPVF